MSSDKHASGEQQQAAGLSEGLLPCLETLHIHGQQSSCYSVWKLLRSADFPSRCFRLRLIVCWGCHTSWVWGTISSLLWPFIRHPPNWEVWPLLVSLLQDTKLIAYQLQAFFGKKSRRERQMCSMMAQGRPAQALTVTRGLQRSLPYRLTMRNQGVNLTLWHGSRIEHIPARCCPKDFVRQWQDIQTAILPIAMFDAETSHLLFGLQTTKVENLSPTDDSKICPHRRQCVTFAFEYAVDKIDQVWKAASKPIRFKKPSSQRSKDRDFQPKRTGPRCFQQYEALKAYKLIPISVCRTRRLPERWRRTRQSPRSAMCGFFPFAKSYSSVLAPQNSTFEVLWGGPSAKRALENWSWLIVWSGTEASSSFQGPHNPFKEWCDTSKAHFSVWRGNKAAMQTCWDPVRIVSVLATGLAILSVVKFCAHNCVCDDPDARKGPVVLCLYKIRGARFAYSRPNFGNRIWRCRTNWNGWRGSWKLVLALLRPIQARTAKFISWKYGILNYALHWCIQISPTGAWVLWWIFMRSLSSAILHSKDWKGVKKEVIFLPIASSKISVSVIFFPMTHLWWQ